MIKISIITINYNNLIGLKCTWNSILPLMNTLQVEWVVVDGGSTDGSYEFILSEEIQSILGKKISEKDSGIYNAMNKGVKNAQGEYLLFLNSGDCLSEEFASGDFFKDFTGEDIIYGDSYESEGDGKYILHKQPLLEKLTLDFFLKGYLCHSSVFFRRDLFEKRLYDESYKIAADFEYIAWQLCINKCSAKHIDIPISKYQGGGISQTHYYDIALPERKRALSSMLPGGEVWYDALLISKDLKEPALPNQFKAIANMPIGGQRIVSKILQIVLSLYSFVKRIC